MPTIGAVLIVKNEEAHLADCLGALVGVVDEIVVVDTGSEDGSVSIAEEYGARCFNYVWVDDFAAARNFGLAQSTAAYVLVVDADECLLDGAGARGRLEGFIAGHGEATLGTIEIVNRVGLGRDVEETVDHTRRFFCRERFHFRGVIHEQLVARTGFEEGVVGEAATGLTVLHSGYAQGVEDPAHKAHRNIRLLEKAIAGCPEDEYYHYQLGKAYFSLRRFEEAVGSLETALGLMQFSGGDVPVGHLGALSRAMVTDAIVSLAYGYGNLEQFAVARALVEGHVALGHPGTDRADFHHVRGYVYLMLGDLSGARAAYLESQRYGAEGEDVRGTGTYASAYHLGLVCEGEGDLVNALGYQEAALRLKPDYVPSIGRCIDLVVEGPCEVPKAVWEMCDQAVFVETFLEKIGGYLDKGDVGSAGLLVAAAGRISTELLMQCKGCLERFVDE